MSTLRAAVAAAAFAAAFGAQAQTAVTLYGIRPTSIPAALDIRNGDQLRAINGVPIEDERQLFQIYRRLDELTHIELTGFRNGKHLHRTLILR